MARVTQGVAGADDLSPIDARPCPGPAPRAGAAREELRHLADDHLGATGAAGAPARLRHGRGRPAPRRPCGGGGRQPAAAVRQHAGGAGAGRRADSAVPGRGQPGIRVPDQQRRGAVRGGRKPGAGRQAAGDARAVPAAGLHLVRRPAWPAQVRRARPGQSGCTDGSRRRPRPARCRLLRRRGGTLPAAGCGGHVLHQRHHRQPQGRGAHPFQPARPRRRRPGLRQADRPGEVLAYMPPAWIGQNIFSYAQWLCCGYIVNCPESPPPSPST
jgi:hypothetical protein